MFTNLFFRECCYCKSNGYDYFSKKCKSSKVPSSLFLTVSHICEISRSKNPGIQLEVVISFCHVACQKSARSRTVDSRQTRTPRGRWPPLTCSIKVKTHTLRVITKCKMFIQSIQCSNYFIRMHWMKWYKIERLWRVNWSKYSMS